MILMKRKFGQWWNRNIYPEFLSLSRLKSISIFHHLIAEADRDFLKLPMLGYVQANSASQ